MYERCAEQAVARLQAVIEKAQRAIGGERREPHGQARELHRHWIEIHAVQTSLRDLPPDRDALALAEIGRVAASRADERLLVRRCEVAARRHEKCAAAHCWIDDPQTENPFGRRIADERSDRAAHDVLRDRLRRVKRSRRLADAGSPLQRHAGRSGARLIVEQRFVHGAELLDAEVAIRDAFAAGAVRRAARRQRQYCAACRLVVEVAPFGERRACGREEPAVERRDAQFSGAAAGVSEARHRAQRVPPSGAVRRGSGRCAQRFDAVALAVHRVPQRNERPRLGEQQEEDAVHDRQRLLEAVVERPDGSRSPAAGQRSENA